MGRFPRVAPCPYARLHAADRDRGARRLLRQPGPSFEAVVTTDTRALLRPARTPVLITGLVLMVVLSLPAATGLAVGDGDPEHVPHARAGADHAARSAEVTEPVAETGTSEADGPDERVGPGEHPMLTAATTPVTCEQRATPRDLPEAVPACALRLAAWEQPWWPLPHPHPDPLPEQLTSGELPPTRAPPLTAPTTV